MEKDFFELILQNGQKQELKKIYECNQYTQKFGVKLTEEEAVALLKSRKENLKEQERVEFGEGILSKLIMAFCDSTYIYQDNYSDTLACLQEIFYLYKNESLDELTDDELIEFMKEHFDGDCQGSLEYLEETVLESFARSVREGSRGFLGNYEEEEDEF